MKPGNISLNFTHNEFADPTTGEVRLASGFLEKLEALREVYRRPMNVTSGCRSGAHNDWLIRRGYNASPNSFHLMDNPKYKADGCCACDVARPNAVDLALLIMLALTHGWAVGIGPTFVHIDRRADFTTLPSLLFTY